MLTTNIPSVPQSENNVDFTLDDFLQFYRNIASQSYQKSSPHHSVLTLVREKLFRYVASLIAEDISLINFTPLHRKSLVGQMTTLLQKNIITSPLEPKKLAVMVQDILRNGETLKTIITPDDKDALPGYLTNINDECQAMEPVANTASVQLKTGLSKTEQNTIVYGENYFSSLPAIALCNRGLEKLKQQEWQNAVEYFQQAIAAEYHIAEECHIPPNLSNIYLYDRNIAYTFNMEGFSLQQAGNYSGAITTYNKSIVTIQAIPTYFRNAQDPDTSILCHRNISMCENYFANSLYHINQLSEAILHYKLAISEIEKIPEANHNDFDSLNVSIYKRYLSFTLNNKGNEFFDQKKFAEALMHYESAKLTITEIKPEWRQENDSIVEAMLQANKELAQINIDIGMVTANRNAFFNTTKRSCAEPEAEPEEPPRKKQKLR
jgi:tetratricopeptide (TPR) repeat protein